MREGGHTCNAGGVSAELSDGEGAVVVESAGGPAQIIIVQAYCGRTRARVLIKWRFNLTQRFG